MYGIDTKPFAKLFDQASYGLDEFRVFNDFLDMAICAFSREQYEKEYLEIVGKYKKETVELLAKLLGQLVISMQPETDTTDLEGKQLYQVGANDILGNFYMERFSNSRQGQFFTPPHISDMMAIISLGDDVEDLRGRKVLDPACGSGQMLLSGKKICPFMKFYGADLDPTCCKMATINMFLNGMTGEIAHMNSLTFEFYKSYKIWGYPRLRVDINTDPNNSSLIPQIAQLHEENPEQVEQIKIKQGQVKMDFSQNVEFEKTNKKNKPKKEQHSKREDNYTKGSQLKLF